MANGRPHCLIGALTNFELATNLGEIPPDQGARTASLNWTNSARTNAERTCHVRLGATTELAPS